MSEKTKKLTLTIRRCIDILNFSEFGPGGKLPGIEWSFFLACISCNTVLMKHKKAADAAKDVKNIAEGKSKSEGKKLVESWEEFVRARAELQKAHAKTENGQPMVVGKTVIMEDQAAFQSAFEELKAKYQDAIDAREEQLKRVNEKLDSEVSITLPTIAKADLPDQITREAIGPLAMLIR